MKGQRVGYIRVSSVLQNTDRQLEGLELDRTFIDKVSGKDTNRPELAEMIKFVRAGDTVLIHSMDRLARNLDDLKKIVKELTTKGVKFQFLKENLTFTGEDSPMSNLLLSMLGAVAEFERALINERQKEGVQIAKANGKYTGRKREMTAERITEIRARVNNGDSKAEIARDMKISRDTLYRYL